MAVLSFKQYANKSSAESVLKSLSSQIQKASNLLRSVLSLDSGNSVLAAHYVPDGCLFLEKYDAFFENDKFLKWLTQNGFRHPISDKKSGVEGTCYFDSSKRTACKVTRSYVEAELAALLLDSKEYGQLTAVRAVSQVVMSEWYSVFAIIENVIKVFSDEKGVAEASRLALNYISQWLRGWKQGSQEMATPAEHTIKVNELYSDMMSEDSKKMLAMILRVIFVTLDKTGRLWHDLKLANIGFDSNGNFILFDLGMNSTVFLKPVPQIGKILLASGQGVDLSDTPFPKINIKINSPVEFDNGKERGQGHFVGYSPQRGYMISTGSKYVYLQDPKQMRVA